MLSLIKKAHWNLIIVVLILAGITGGDDYAAMEQALQKRYERDLEEDKIPDIFVDGGKGNQIVRWTCSNIFRQNDKNRPHLIVGKGVGSSSWAEVPIISKQDREIHLPDDSLALHLIQHIRDESHNHAISGHRKNVKKPLAQSGLETIEGVGAKRRQALLKYLGGLQRCEKGDLRWNSLCTGNFLKLAETIFETLKTINQLSLKCK